MESEQQAAAGGDIPGLEKTVRIIEGAQLELTEIRITGDEAARRLGRAKGTYITARSTSGRLCDACECSAERARALAGVLTGLIGEKGRFLIVGLGNTEITPDSLGPRTASQVLATRHIKKLASDLDTSELAETAVIAPGVMAQTGMEAQTIVRSLCRETEPELVIAVDALACAELGHLGSVVQLCSTGISPGSGVENARAELSEATLGVPTVAIGVPTVTDCAVIAEQCGGELEERFSGMIVAPRDIDALVKRTAELISEAVNLALHPTLSPEDLRLIVG